MILISVALRVQEEGRRRTYENGGREGARNPPGQLGAPDGRTGVGLFFVSIGQSAKKTEANETPAPSHLSSVRLSSVPSSGHRRDRSEGKPKWRLVRRTRRMRSEWKCSGLACLCLLPLDSGHKVSSCN